MTRNVELDSDLFDSVSGVRIGERRSMENFSESRASVPHTLKKNTCSTASARISSQDDHTGMILLALAGA